jgi:hypothetical protein
MNNTQAHHNQLLEKQKFLIDMSAEYTIKVINGNYELISKMFTHKTFKQSEYTMDELKFIKSVRSYIKKNEIYALPHFQDTQVFPEDVHYVKVARVPMYKKFENVCEVDIDQAYWETAYQLGIISDDIYAKGSKGNISKKARLTALGSLARKTYHYKFKGDKLLDTIIDKEPLLENLWFTICKRVSDVMHQVISALGDDFIFYWVDGIYFNNTPENVSKAMSVFIENGYNSKFKKINQIYFHEAGFTVNDYGDIKREFSYPNYDKKGARINYAENFKLASVANKIINKGVDMTENLKIQMDAELREAGFEEEGRVKKEKKAKKPKKITKKTISELSKKGISVTITDDEEKNDSKEEK